MDTVPKKTHTRKIVWSIVTVLVIGVGGFVLWGGSGTPVEMVTIARGDIREIVRVTGKTEAARDADLAFETSGKVSAVYKKIGDFVSTGDVLATIGTEHLEDNLAEAIALRDADAASLKEIESGTRQEQINISKAKLQSAEIAEIDARSQLQDKIRDIYTKLDDAVRNKVDQFIDNPRTNPQLQFNMSDFELESAIERQRLDLSSILESLLVLANKNDGDTVLQTSAQVKSYVFTGKNFLDSVALAINGLSPNSSLSQTTLDLYKADVLSARSNVQTALTALLAAEEKVRASSSTVLVAEQDLNLLIAGSTSDQIAIAKARLAQREAAIQKINTDIRKTSLRSPLNGIVTKQNATVGEIVSAGTPVVSVISDDALHITVYIPEVDIGRVAVGNNVDITLDAFSQDILKGVISYIDPAETIVDGVVNYEATIVFENTDSRLRSGLTANLYIETAYADNVLLIPQFAVIEKDAGTFVEKDVDGIRTEVPITIGIRGDNGILEVTSGLSAGDQVYNIGLK